MINAYVTWKAKRGDFEAYFPEFKDKKVMMPEEFIILDQSACITGFDTKDNTPIYSNEVHNSKEEEFVVRTKDHEVIKGIYTPEWKDSWLKFTKVLTVYESGAINKYYFSGTSIGTVSDELKKIDASKFAIKFNGVEKKGTFHVFKFTQGSEITADVLKKVWETYKAHLDEIEAKKEEGSSNKWSVDLPF